MRSQIVHIYQLICFFLPHFVLHLGGDIFLLPSSVHQELPPPPPDKARLAVETLEDRQHGHAAKLVNVVRSMAEIRRDYVVVKVDLKNAYNEVSRSAII